MKSLMVLIGVLFAQQEPAVDEARIGSLIQDLGAPDYEVRQKADEELRKIGDPAVAALKKAVEDADAERAMRARSILRGIEERSKLPKEPSQDRAWLRMHVEYHDLGRGITFKMDPETGLELTVPVENPDTGKREFKTFKAESIEEFREKFPELAKEYDIEKYLPRPMEPGAFHDRFEDLLGRDLEGWLKERLQGPGEEANPFGDEWLDRLNEQLNERFQGMEERLRNHLRRFEGPPGAGGNEQGPGFEQLPEPPPAGPTFGIRIGSVSDALRIQLALGEDEGVQVFDVEPGSPAEKVGVRKHDIITKVDGETLKDRWKLREFIRDMLGKKEFALEVIRAGARSTLTVPVAAAEEQVPEKAEK